MIILMNSYRRFRISNMYITELAPLNIGDGNGYLIDGFNRVFTIDKKRVKCKKCNTQIEWVYNYSYHCTDNLLHDVKNPNNRYVDK